MQLRKFCLFTTRIEEFVSLPHCMCYTNFKNTHPQNNAVIFYTGAAFTEGLSSGLSNFVVVFCHELPHELGKSSQCINGGFSRWIAYLSVCFGFARIVSAGFLIYGFS